MSLSALHFCVIADLTHESHALGKKPAMHLELEHLQVLIGVPTTHDES
jgi:hypothetical protein